MKNFERRAHYHETDQMGVIHHANYLKWMEEARTDFLDQIGFTYKKMEDCGVISPVVGVTIDYKNSVYYNDIVYFIIKINEYNGVRLELSYEIYNKETNKLCVTATSKHCFIKDGKIVSLKKALPEFHQRFEECYASL